MKTSIKILQYIILIYLIYYLYNNNYFNFEFFNSFFDKKVFFIVFLLSFTTVLLNAYRWLLILKSHNLNINFLDTFNLVYIGSFFNNILPGSYGGDLVRIYYITKFTKQNKLKIASTILLDRIYGLIGLIILGDIVFYFICHEYNIIKFFINLNLLIFLIIIIFFISFKKLYFVRTYFNKIKIFFQIQKKTFLKCIFISCVLFFFVHMSVYIISTKFFEIETSLSVVFFSNTLSTISSIIPITPGGLGVSELVYVKINQNLFSIYFQNLANVIIYFRLCNILTCLPSLFIFLSYKIKN